MIPILVCFIVYFVMLFNDAPVYLAFGFAMVVMFLVIIDNTLEKKL